MASRIASTLLFSSLILLLQLQSSQSLICSSQKLTKNNKEVLFDHCSDLPNVNSFLHWTYSPEDYSLTIAFLAAPAASGGWIAWAINPTSTGMIGAQSLIAFRQADGSVAAKTFNVSSYRKIEPSEIAFPVEDMEAEMVDGVMRLYAKITLTEEIGTVVNQVWQVGAAVVDGVPAVHDFGVENLNAVGTLDLMNGESINGGDRGADSKERNRNIHGIVNVVSWGVLFPIGVIMARYVKALEFGDPAWFYLHVGCQLCAYAIGVAGWGTGLKLGNQSEGVVYKYHRNIGISLFTLATLQMLALFLRPKKDHKFRMYWTIYHRGVGFTILVLGIINVFKGFDILTLDEKLIKVYVIILIFLGVVSLLLEGTKWLLVLKKKSPKPNDANIREQVLVL